jgi:hypothetical protein
MTHCIVLASCNTRGVSSESLWLTITSFWMLQQLGRVELVTYENWRHCQERMLMFACSCLDYGTAMDTMIVATPNATMASPL